MMDWSDDPSHMSELLLPQSYISLPNVWINILENICSLKSNFNLQLKCVVSGGIAPNEVIARSEFEVHRQMFTEWM